MISPLRRLASSTASLLFPAPVGPEITITFSFSDFLFLFEVVPSRDIEQAVATQKLRRNARLGGCSLKQHVRVKNTPLLIAIIGSSSGKKALNPRIRKIEEVYWLMELKGWPAQKAHLEERRRQRARD